MANATVVEKEYRISIFKELKEEKYDAIIFAVAHDSFKEIKFDGIQELHGIIYNAKSFLDRAIIKGRL